MSKRKGKIPQTPTPAPAPEPQQLIVRLCIDCKNLQKSFTLPATLRACTSKGLAVNFIDGKQSFPVVIARGYQQLCGPAGRLWEPKA